MGWSCILGPSSLYFMWVFPHLWREGAYALPLATLAVFFMTSGFLLATCCSDPGIIPRREVILATQTGSRLEDVLGYNPLDSELPSHDPVQSRRNVPKALWDQGYRWCSTCRIVRPPRASHCPDCDNCVLRYDHHCPFVNNCVGQRNYHFFFGFVTMVLCLAIMVLPVLFSFCNADNFEVSLEAVTYLNQGIFWPVFYALIAFGVFAALAAVLSGVLWAYHLFLIATKRTTKEFRRNIENVAEEPTLCGERGPRLYNPWALVDPHDLVRVDEPPITPDPPAVCCCMFDDY